MAVGTRNFTGRNWLGISGVIIGISGFIFALFAYFNSIEKRSPMFVTDPVRAEILNKERILDAPIIVTQKNGRKIENDLTSIRFYFWNNGKKPIKRVDILQNIKITVADTTSEILDFVVMRMSRPVTGITLERSAGADSLRALVVSFNILESKDGFCGQLIYEGESKSDLIISGCIEGVGYLPANRRSPIQEFFSGWIKSEFHVGFPFFIFGVIFFIGVFYAIVMYLALKRYVKGERPLSAILKSYPPHPFDMGLLKVLIYLMIFSFVFLPYGDFKRNKDKLDLREVPAEIMPSGN